MFFVRDKKLNTSGYHPQTDGLVEKFNCTLINMISKHTDAGTVEWDQQLQLLLFAYRMMVQESTRESPFFLLYGRDPRLPTGTQLDGARKEHLVDMDDYRTELVMSMAKIALENICRAQRKQKEFYDRHSGETTYYVGERFMVYMPGTVSGKRWKIVRPYHGPTELLISLQLTQKYSLLRIRVSLLYLLHLVGYADATPSYPTPVGQEERSTSEPRAVLTSTETYLFNRFEGKDQLQGRWPVPEN